MDFAAFLERVIEDGIAAARADYTKPEQKSKLEGSIEGFEACRGKTPAELASLLDQVARNRQQAFMRLHEQEISTQEYWKTRCREAEIEWVLNVVSAALHNSGQPPITAFTARGVLAAAKILGVQKS